MRIIEKTFHLLESFLIHGDELSLGELSRYSGFTKPTTRRIALALVQCGLLKQQQPRGKYSLGMRFIDFSQALKKQNPLFEVAEPFLYKLEQDTEETVCLAVWDGRNAVMCKSIHPNHPLRVTAYEGTLTGFHFNSLGKAILAELSPQELDAFLPLNMKQFTPNTIINIDDLKNHLLIVRREGVAIDDEEGFPGVRGIAAVFHNREVEVAGAITILGPSIRLTREKIRAFIPVVKECARDISTALGYQTEENRPSIVPGSASFSGAE